MKSIFAILQCLTFSSYTYSQVIELNSLLSYENSFEEFETDIHKHLEIDTIFSGFQFVDGGISYKAYIPEFKDVNFVAISDKRLAIAIVNPTLQEYLSSYNDILHSSCLKIKNSDKWDWHCVAENKLIKIGEADENIGYIIISIE
jgi:hypothetical protein